MCISKNFNYARKKYGLTYDQIWHIAQKYKCYYPVRHPKLGYKFYLFIDSFNKHLTYERKRKERIKRLKQLAKEKALAKKQSKRLEVQNA